MSTPETSPSVVYGGPIPEHKSLLTSLNRPLSIGIGLVLVIASVFIAPAAAHGASACVGWNAVESIGYKVDGKTVSTFTGNVKPGSTVEANVSLKDNCATTPIGLATYKTKSNVWEDDTADEQELAGSSTRKKSGNLRTTVPNCFYQLDLFTGPVIQDLTTKRYDANLLVADNGGTKACGTTASVPTSAVAPTTTTTIVVSVHDAPAVPAPKPAPEIDTPLTVEVSEQIETPIETPVVETPVVATAPVESYTPSTEAPAALATTGISTWLLTGIGVALLALGRSLLVARNRLIAGRKVDFR